MFGPQSAPAHATIATNLGGPLSTYGANGRVRYDIGRGKDYPRRAQFDSQGRTLVLGWGDKVAPPNWDVGTGQYSTAVVTRQLRNGSLDPTFGDGGIVDVHPPDEPRILAHPVDLAVLPDGGAAVLYMRENYGITYGVLRLDADGHPLTTFGPNGDGYAPVQLPNEHAGTAATVLARRADGELVIGGVHYDPNQPTAGRRPFVTALNADGSPDYLFGVDGFTLLPTTPQPSTDGDWVGDIAFPSDGGILVGVHGGVRQPGGVWRLLDHGAINPAFGTLGHVEFDTYVVGESELLGWGPLAVHPSGAFSLRTGVRYTRFLASGQPDPSFGTNGVTYVHSLAPQTAAADGEALIVLGEGSVATGNKFRDVMTFERILPDGTFDTTFGVAGRTNALVAPSSLEQVVVDEARRRIVAVVGTVENAMVALDTDGTLDDTFGTDGIAYFDASSGVADQVTAACGDGKGGTWIGGNTDLRFVTHLDPNGGRIEAFGDDGTVALREFPPVAALLPSADGGVTVVGAALYDWQPKEVQVVKLDASGAPDPSFNGGQPAHLALIPAATRFSATLLRDGRLVLVSGAHGQVLLPDGTPDTSVSADGLFDTGFIGGVVVAARGDGFIAASIEPAALPGTTRVVVRAYVAPGQPDASFGVAGASEIVTDDLGSVTNMIVGPANITIGTPHHVYRLLASGQPNPLFVPPTYAGTGDTVWVDIGVQSDGAVIVTDGAETRRYLGTGAIDTTFGDRGRITPGFGADNYFATTRALVAGTQLRFVGTVRSLTQVGTQEDIGVVARDGSITGGVPRLSIHDLRVREGDYGYDTAAMDVTFDRAPDTNKASFDVKLFSRTGTAGVDAQPGTPVRYYAQLGTAGVHDAAAATIEVGVAILNDRTAEPNEQLDLRAVGVNYLAIGDGSGTLTIDNNDPVGSSVIATTQPYVSFGGGAVVTRADVDGDGIDEIVTAPNQTGGPHVRVLRLNSSGSFTTVAEFMAFDSRFRGGVSLGAGDVDGDGRDEILVAPASQAPPVVRIFDIANGAATLGTSFLAYDRTMKAGLNVAGGHLDGDGRAEIITAPRQGGGPHVRVFSLDAGNHVATRAEAMVYESEFAGGVSLATTSARELVVAPGAGRSVDVKLFVLQNGSLTAHGGFPAYPGWTGGVNIVARKFDDRMPDFVMTAPMAGGGPHVIIWQPVYEPGFNPGYPKWAPWFQFMADSPTFTGGITAAAGRLVPNGPVDAFTITGAGKPVALSVRRFRY
jgi:uncharacterized delta-60 repeat protein